MVCSGELGPVMGLPGGLFSVHPREPPADSFPLAPAFVPLELCLCDHPPAIPVGDPSGPSHPFFLSSAASFLKFSKM